MADGAQSLTEIRYLRGVERAHGLPTGRRQRHVYREGRVNYDDVYYEAYRLIVELDGATTHPIETTRQDRWRDNLSAADDHWVLRFDLADVTARACRTAAQVVARLTYAGWTGKPTRCGPSCALTG